MIQEDIWVEDHGQPWYVEKLIQMMILSYYPHIYHQNLRMILRYKYHIMKTKIYQKFKHQSLTLEKRLFILDRSIEILV